jgi:hypothetical protein
MQKNWRRSKWLEFAWWLEFARWLEFVRWLEFMRWLCERGVAYGNGVRLLGVLVDKSSEGLLSPIYLCPAVKI